MRLPWCSPHDTYAHSHQITLLRLVHGLIFAVQHLHTIRTQSRFDDRACFGAGGGTAQWDDMLDLQCVVMVDDALDDQLQNGLAFDHARSVQSRLDPFTE